MLAVGNQFDERRQDLLSLGCCNLGEQSPSAFLVLKISLAQHNNSKELPKKPHEAGLPEQMPTDALS